MLFPAGQACHRNCRDAQAIAHGRAWLEEHAKDNPAVHWRGNTSSICACIWCSKLSHAIESKSPPGAKKVETAKELPLYLKGGVIFLQPILDPANLQLSSYSGDAAVAALPPTVLLLSRLGVLLFSMLL